MNNSNEQQQPQPPIDKNKLKDELRESRFHFRNLAEHELRRDLKEEAMLKCDPEIKAFANCSQESGLWVVWTCRGLFQKVNDCMHVYNSEDVWQRYRKENEEYIEKHARREHVREQNRRNAQKEASA